MLPFRTILFPVDYSEPCRAMIPYVKDMRRHFPAELTLVHAYGPEALAYSKLPLADPGLPEEARAIQEQLLREFSAKEFPGEHCGAIVERGEPGTVIHEVVQRQGADLVMMPTHGRGPLRRLLLGSVTAKVLHDVSAVVWTGVHSAVTEHQPGVPYKSILCALDRGEEAETVLKAAAAFANCYRAQLTLLHVVETPPGSWEIDFTPYNREIVDAANQWLREMKGSLGLDVPHTVLDSTIPEGVRQEAIRRKADLAIVGRGQAQSTFSRIWSRLYPIVRESPCPVLSI